LIKKEVGTVVQNTAALLARYQSIIPDIAALERVLHTALPQTAWFNALRVDREQLKQSFAKNSLEALPWCEDGFRFDSDIVLGKSWQYRVGLLQIQEEVSMLPVKCLAPLPTDCVLDMCAAPGNKTAQLAVAMQNQGTIVANDIHYQRLRALGQITQRLGLMNINFHVGDGTSLPRAPAVFDKILVDAPCSCEGTLRKGRSRVVLSSKANSENMAVTQIALLKKAIQLLKPGGRLVYSTCTFAPEENECVIDTILKQYAAEIVLCPIDIAHFSAQPGITFWQGRRLSSELEKAWRIWPHLNNTGGFFIAVLEKKEKTSAATLSPTVLPQSELRYAQTSAVSDFVSVVQQRFSISPSQLARYHYYMPSNRGIYAAHRSNLALYAQPLSSFQCDSVGLFFIKTRIRYPKLSSAAVMAIGHLATAHVVELKAPQLPAFLSREDIRVSPEQRVRCAQTGYVVVKYNDIAIGLGLLFVRQETVEWVMRSLYPRYW